jgi:hypothetical protein
MQLGDRPRRRPEAPPANRKESSLPLTEMRMLSDKFSHIGRRSNQCATGENPRREKREGVEWQNQD